MHSDSNHPKAFFYSLLAYSVLIILCYIAAFTSNDDIAEQPSGGVEVAIGTSDQGSGDDASESSPAAATSVIKKSPERLITSEDDAASLPTSVKRVKIPPKKIIKRDVVDVRALFKAGRSGKGAGETGRPGSQGKPEGSELSSNYHGSGSGGGGVVLNLNGRNFIRRPALADESQLEGRIVVAIVVDRDGSISTAKAGARGTTIQNEELWRRCERAVLDAKLNQVESGPEIQTGQVVFSFKLL